ncbi:MAG: ABC transporter permease [Candidatus Aquicultorales bacterium]
MKTILTIWKKELRDNMRDRRTVMAMILMPLIIMPAFLIGMDKFVAYQRKQSQERAATVAFASKAPASLGDFLAGREKIEVKAVSDITEAVREGAVDVGISTPADFEDRLASGQPAAVTLLRDSTKIESQEALAKVTLAINTYGAALVNTRLRSSGIDPSELQQVTVEEEDVSTAEERGGFGLGFFLPFFVIVWAITGGQYIAIDVSAGEKERKTLEALLLTPTKRLQIVMGKFLAVSTTAGVSVIVSLGSMFVAFKSFGLGPMQGSSGPNGSPTGGAEAVFAVEPAAYLVMLGIGLLLVLMFSAVLLSIAIFAKSFKEAQNYIGPAYLVAILPAVLMNAMFSVKPTAGFYLIPIVNAMLVFKDALVGKYEAINIVLTVGTLTACAAGAIYMATRIYSQEKVMVG